MRALKIEDRQLTSNPSQQPSSSRRKKSSKPSSELSSSEECLAAEKGERNERKWRMEAAGKVPLSIADMKGSELIESLYILRLI